MLVFNNDFNIPIDYYPHWITYIQFGYKFNYPVDNLPENLEYLDLR